MKLGLYAIEAIIEVWGVVLQTDAQTLRLQCGPDHTLPYTRGVHTKEASSLQVIQLLDSKKQSCFITSHVSIFRAFPPLHCWSPPSHLCLALSMACFRLGRVITPGAFSSRDLVYSNLVTSHASIVFSRPISFKPLCSLPASIPISKETHQLDRYYLFISVIMITRTIMIDRYGKTMMEFHACWDPINNFIEIHCFKCPRSPKSSWAHVKICG